MTGLTPAQYLLRWNDHLTNYGDLFLTLREEEEFVDCSLACEDGLVGAHKMVLAGCSPYLRDLFSRINNPHPVICLLNTPRSLVLLLMEFIYRGQVHIPQNRLHQLVMLGRSLRIKGLAQIMVPVSDEQESSSPDNNKQNNNNNNKTETDLSESLTPMAFPHNFAFPSLGSLAFTPTATRASSNDISILSCDMREEKNENMEDEDLEAREERETNDSIGREEGDAVEEDEVEEGGGVNYNPAEKKKVVLKKPRNSKKSGSPHSNIGDDNKYPYKATQYSTVKEKCKIGAYAEEHGIEDTKQFVRKEYSTKIRSSTIENFMKIYNRYKTLEEKRKNKNAMKPKKKKEDEVE